MSNKIKKISIGESSDFDQITYICSIRAREEIDSVLQQNYHSHKYLRATLRQLYSLNYLQSLEEDDSCLFGGRPEKHNIDYAIKELHSNMTKSFYMSCVKFLYLFLPKQIYKKIYLNLPEAKYPLSKVVLSKEGLIIDEIIDTPIKRLIDHLKFKMNSSPLIIGGLIGVRSKLLFLILKILNSEFYKYDSFRSLKSFLNWSLKRDVFMTSVLMSKLNYKKIIVSGDSSPSSRILIYSIKELNLDTKFVSVLHGFPFDMTLSEILPIYADKTYVWTEECMKEIRKILRNNEKKKIGYIFPKYFFSCHRREFNKALLCLNDMSLIERKGMFCLLEDWIKVLRNRYSHTIIRLHPREMSKYQKRIEIIIKNKGPNTKGEVVISSSKSISDDFKRVDHVYTTRSSVLVESINSGLKTFLITDLVKPCLVDKTLSFEPVELKYHN